MVRVYAPRSPSDQAAERFFQGDALRFGAVPEAGVLVGDSGTWSTMGSSWARSSPSRRSEVSAHSGWAKSASATGAEVRDGAAEVGDGAAAAATGAEAATAAPASVARVNPGPRRGSCFC